jgi:hypothetical protein
MLNKYKISPTSNLSSTRSYQSIFFDTYITATNMMKSASQGEGFYSHPNPVYQSEGFVI